MLIENKSYIVWRMVLFSDGHGFILSKNLRPHNFYITLQFTQENGRPRCYRGGYHGDPQEAHRDFRQRVKDYQQKHGVRIARIYGMNIGGHNEQEDQEKADQEDAARIAYCL